MRLHVSLHAGPHEPHHLFVLSAHRIQTPVIWMACPSSWTGRCEKSSVGSDTAGTKTNPAHTLSSARACRLKPVVFPLSRSAGLSTCMVVVFSLQLCGSLWARLRWRPAASPWRPAGFCLFVCYHLDFDWKQIQNQFSKWLSITCYVIFMGWANGFSLKLVLFPGS